MLSLLHYAALWGHVDTATALIDSGAEMDAPDDRVETHSQHQSSIVTS